MKSIYADLRAMFPDNTDSIIVTEDNVTALNDLLARYDCTVQLLSGERRPLRLQVRQLIDMTGRDPVVWSNSYGGHCGGGTSRIATLI
ncbi:MAG: hypothetical protein ACREUG_17030 [Steroidobacteraceae bacterium]